MLRKKIGSTISEESALSLFSTVLIMSMSHGRIEGIERHILIALRMDL